MLTVRRTANSGCLLSLDGVSFLLDGVCREVEPYLATSQDVRLQLMESLPDVVAFTHEHGDHYDPEYAEYYTRMTGRQVIGPGAGEGAYRAGNVRMRALKTRHIGKSDCAHLSFILEGSCCVWFTGDASPLHWRGLSGLPKPDVLIVPYAYAATPSAWKDVLALCPHTVVLMHLPEEGKDELGLRKAVMQTTAGFAYPKLILPEMEEAVYVSD